ncbi:cobalamin-binding protein [Pelomyxa schiedti]|nr:cobalamin-binding protein [Pelomyxa schiedti]
MAATTTADKEGATRRLYEAVLNGEAPGVTEAATRAALGAGARPADVVSGCLIPAMVEAGRLFEICEYFVPELLISARAMKSAMAILKPLIVSEVSTEGSTANAPVKVAVGTVKGDIHDIGKSLVGAMLEGYGFDVIDLGADVPVEKFVEAVRDRGATIIGLSALLTTTMPRMKDVIDALVGAGVRGKVKVIVGGAPVTDQFAKQIGADGYAPDASSAARLVKSII